ncbi:hypothetical protein [Sulfurimonas sp. C5]|uniref:hypothetical protein n=1 Tax=Sulfurimonas sp. C5 TaxID=3036947 RepID=UPI0024559243|nr:hypothetical protein [Sulfurimonas sp. C5]MDH4945376.1 hypothetical protein [Sulfurimonas sp. C5]
MKKNLGRFLFVFLFLYSVLEASTYKWYLDLNKKNVVTNEAVYFKYTCVFSDKSELYVIEFNPVTDNKNYSIKLLSEKEQIIDNHRENSFEFVLYVKNGGDFKLDLEATMKKTNKDSIENTVLGRDNRAYEEYSIKKFPLQSIKLNVTPIDQKLVGKFTLQTKQDDSKITQFEPYHLEIILEGKGDFKIIQPFHFNIPDVKVFQEEPKLEIELTKEGTQGRWSQKFAFVSDKDFTIPAQQLQYYDLIQQTIHTLQTKPVQIKVQKSSFTKEDLLDVKEEQTFHFKKEYFYYFLTFIAGFLVAKIKFRSRKKENRSENKLCEKISQMKSLEQVNVLLILEEDTQYKELIEQIETKQIKSLKEVKRLICG